MGVGVGVGIGVGEDERMKRPEEVGPGKLESSDQKMAKSSSSRNRYFIGRKGLDPKYPTA